MNLEEILELCLTNMNDIINIVIVLNVICILGEQIYNINNMDKNLNNTKDEESRVEFYKTEKDPNNFFNVIDEYTIDLKDFLNKFLDDSNIFDLIMNFIYNWKDMLYLSQLSIVQLNALTSLTSAIVILTCTLNIISILFPNYIVTIFHLKNKIQKLMDIIKLRRNINHFYLIFLILMIIFMTLGLIFTNLLLLLFY